MKRELNLICTKRIRWPDKETKRKAKKFIKEHRIKRAIYIEVRCGVCRQFLEKKIIDKKKVYRPYESIIDQPKKSYREKNNVTGSYDFVLCLACFKKLSKILGSRDKGLNYLQSFLTDFTKTRKNSYALMQTGWYLFDIFIFSLIIIIQPIVGFTLIFNPDFARFAALGYIFAGNWIIFILLLGISAEGGDPSMLDALMVNPSSRAREKRIIALNNLIVERMKRVIQK